MSRALLEDEQLLKENNDCFMKRPGDCDEVSGTAAFLCSEDASYITGETIIVSGGSNARL